MTLTKVLKRHLSGNMSEKVTLSKTEYLVGYLEEDIQPLLDMIMKNYNLGRNMDKDIFSIRNEDIRIDFTPQLQRIIRVLCEEWKKNFEQEIELCWQNKEGQDPNTSFWAVVHDKNESTNLHSHESSDNYESGAHVSCAFYVKVPPNSGDFVFNYKLNPYIGRQHVIKAEPNKFVMFDSTMPHYVTKNCSDDKRIVISMNFKFKD
jgi:Putative 2OG-Fe(II) oxygenase